MAQSTTFSLIRQLIVAGDVRISEHGYDELVADDIRVRDLSDSVDDATVLEDYPEFRKGPAVLVLQFDSDRRPVHVVWGIPRGFTSPAVLVRLIDPIRHDATTVLLRG